MRFKTPQRVVNLSFAGYLLMTVICFGPATVESERVQAKEERECTPQPQCRAYATQAGVGIFKAVFWPLWISYRLAGGNADLYKERS